MNDLQIFNNEEFGSVRTTLVDGEPWFAAADVCKALDIGNPSQAIVRLDEDEKYTLISNEGRMMNMVSEPGLYSLVLGSRKPEAKAFKRWITHEVIPAIRKNGSYHLPRTYKEALQDLLIQVEKNDILKAENERMKPKEIFADAVNASDTSILVGELAKLITQNGVEIGQNRLFDWLRNRGYLICSGSSKNLPCQRYVEQGLFEIKERTINNPDGSVRVTKTPKVTGKGQIYFINKFLASNGGI